LIDIKPTIADFNTFFYFWAMAYDFDGLNPSGFSPSNYEYKYHFKDEGIAN